MRSPIRSYISFTVYVLPDAKMDVIQRSKGIEIILALARTPRYIQEIRKEVGGSATTVQERVNDLLEEGLIEESTSEEFPFKRVLSLTDKGRTVSTMIKNIETTFKMNLPDAMYRWILVILFCVGEVKGVTRLEKLLFMLKYDLNVVDNSFFTFVPEKFGPYSTDLLYVVSQLNKINIVKITDTSFEPLDKASGEIIVRWDFALTPTGYNLAKELLENLPKEKQEAIKSLKTFNEMKLQELLKYVHEKYPEYVKISTT